MGLWDPRDELLCGTCGQRGPRLGACIVCGTPTGLDPAAQVPLPPDAPFQSQWVYVPKPERSRSQTVVCPTCRQSFRQKEPGQKMCSRDCVFAQRTLDREQRILAASLRKSA